MWAGLDCDLVEDADMRATRLAAAGGAIGLFFLIAGLASARPAPERVSFTGWISCTTCFEPNACKGQPSRWACTQSRVAAGAAYVLVVEDKHYVLSGSDKELAQAAGENSVTISGDLNGNNIAVASVEFTSKKHREQ
jgi:hypothetical protein